MTTPGEKRTAKACRFYAALQRLYPPSFREEYGEMLTLQFRDEFDEVLTKGKRFVLVRFWLFIVFDLFYSSLEEYQQEIMCMDSKKFSTYGYFTAILTAFAWMVIWLGGNVSFIGRSEIVSLSLFSLILIGGAITLLGVVEVVLQHKLFRVLSILLLVITGVFVIENFYLITGFTWLPDLLGYAAFEFIYWFTMFGYFILVVTIGVSVLIKRKWLPAVSMLVVALPVLVNPLVNLFNAYWIITLFGVLSSAGWLLIGWWLKKENSTLSSAGTLEAAG